MPRFSGEILSGDQKPKHRQPNDVLLLSLALNQTVALVFLGALASLGAWLFAEPDVIGAPLRKCPACEEAEAFLDRVSELRVSPCDDFYEHVCGRWGAAPSFEAALTAQGHRALREALSSYPRGFTRAYATFEKLAAYYRSCYMELHRKILKAYSSRDHNESRLHGDAKLPCPTSDSATLRAGCKPWRHTRLNVTNDSTVALDAPKFLKTSLQLFAIADDTARSVYLFAHVVNAVSALYDLNVKVDGRPDVASETCLLRLNVKELSAARRSFEVSTLAPQRTVIAIREMMTLVTLQLVKRVSLNRRVETSARILLSQSLRSYSYKSVFSGPYLNMSRLKSAYKAFPATPNLYQKSMWYAHFLVPEELLYTCVDGRLLADVSQEMCLSPYVLLPPMVYGETDKFFNYASLGFLMATRIVQAFLSPKTRTEEEERAVTSLLETATECHKKAGDAKHSSDVVDALSFAFGLRATLEAYRTWSTSALKSGEKISMLRTFFRRACLTVCSQSPSGHRPHGGSYGRFSSRQACNVAVRSMPELFVAFQCRIVHNMSRNGICTLF
ncbi:hypothetical protein V5799_011197 [Amblyomma americanum]|uniref:Uncharacterized protein n=1 Tax=Amblyomma americanum TaxID=6943 RepID=A0AAQ4EHJ9_AMBAM